MKNKKLIAGLVAAGLLAVSVAAFFGLKGGKEGGLLEEDAFRAVADIENEEFHYFDSEAVALSESSENDAGLRAVAMEASNLVNDERAAAGLDPLDWDINLETVSHVRAKECSQKFSHTRPSGKQWYTVNSKIQGGENLAFGFDTAEDAVEAWMNSPTHRDNILFDEFEKVAISIYQDDDGVCYWAQEYGY
ncbi:MAG: CAP domain-containing protein [Lachnospiraceae bacterium]|nr:CAP domain-containing protein [Lachnospiraceae bacterium]